MTLRHVLATRRVLVVVVVAGVLWRQYRRSGQGRVRLGRRLTVRLPSSPW